ncbi:probable protein phosphatase 2C 43 isoform X4 [Trifolium pratense]|uniref:probable protein phosphatase 2C 43 isoform X4 n=1 Tax=Trifolium pratense TaxID=57577 RepID=UPI001E693180|nr:probable protein phosphatase 2C 43 isoform X4 [Trifolium pratense]
MLKPIQLWKTKAKLKLPLTMHSILEFTMAMVASKHRSMFLITSSTIYCTIGKVGSCCLAGVLWKGVLYVANLGDSRAVIGSVVDKRVSAVQLTRDHNCNDPGIRQELKSMHPGDDTIVMENNGWRVKGIIMVSRSIGDAYLKRPPFSLLNSFPTYVEVPHPFERGVVSEEPEMLTRDIAETDKFLIFASDGLWELMSNDQAVQIVHKNPRNGIAKRLLTTALVEAARRRNVKYRAMMTTTPGKELNVGRRTFHDDISVIVVFLDNKTPLIKKHIHDLSYRGSTDGSQPSGFALSALTVAESHSFTGDLKKSFKKRFKGSTSKGQSSRTAEGLHLLDMERTSGDQTESSKGKSHWDTLRKHLKWKKH